MIREDSCSFISKLDYLLKESAPSDLFRFVAACESEDDLVNKLKLDPSRLFSFIQNMKVEENTLLAARLLYKVDPKDLENPEIKKVEITLRNHGMLNYTCEPTISFMEKGSAFVTAHKSILALESPHFHKMEGFKEFRDDKIVIEEKGISPEVHKLVVEYLYLSDEKRKEFVSTVNKTLLSEIAQLSDIWELDELKQRCDDELCNSLGVGDFSIEKSDMSDWLAQSYLTPKFAMLLGFVNREAVEGDIETL